MAADFQLPQLPPARKQIRNVRRPNLGLYLDRTDSEMDPRAVSACNNAAIVKGEITTRNMGWSVFPELNAAGAQYNLDNLQVLLIDRLETRAGAVISIFANQRDIFYHDAAGMLLKYITPIYATGLCGNDGGPDNFTITGTGGTLWDTQRVTSPVLLGYGNNAVPGMFISFGSATENLPTATWHEIDTVTSDTVLTILTDPGVIAAGTPYTIRQVLTGDNSNQFSSETFPDAQTLLLADGVTSGNRDEDTFYVTNGLEMLEWNGSTATCTWFFPGFVARGLLQHKQILLAYNITEAGEEKPGAIKTSQLNFCEEFSGFEATEFVSANGRSEVLRLLPLGDTIIAYYRQDVETVTFVGPPLFWLIRSAIPGKGLLAANAVVDFGDFHEFLSDDTAYQFDGVTVREVMPQVMREVLRKHAPNRSGGAYAHRDFQNGQVIWSLPLSTDGPAVDQPPVTAYTEHYLEKASDQTPVPVMQRDFPFTATGYFTRGTPALRFSDFFGLSNDDFSQLNVPWDDRSLQASFPYSIAGDGNGNIWILGTASVKGEAAVQADSTYTSKITSFVRFPRFALIDGETNGMLQWVEPFANQEGVAGNLMMQLVMRDRFDDLIGTFEPGPSSPDYDTSFDLLHGAPEKLFGLPGPGRHVAFRAVGRYADLFLQNNVAVKGSFFTCGGYRVSVVPRGFR